MRPRSASFVQLYRVKPLRFADGKKQKAEAGCVERGEAVARKPDRIRQPDAGELAFSHERQRSE
jgi:hypothetical protein